MLLRTPADVGAAIRQRRRRLGLGQQSLADRIGVSRQWVVEIEKGKPRAELALVLRALGTLGMSLSLGETAARPAVDIDAIVEAARRPRP